MMIEAQHLMKDFGRKRVINDLKLDVEEGEFLAIFGPNGSGKTTLLKLLSTLLKPTLGQIKVNGHDAKENGVELRQSIGLVSHETYLYEELTALENLRFYMKLYRVPHTKQKQNEIENLLKQVALYHRMNDPVGTYSRGMKQRLSILRATIHNPKVLLLDEPYTGLDKKGCEVLNKMLTKFNNEGKTILMTTHDIEKGYNVSKRLGILIGGKLIFDTPKSKIGLKELIDTYGGYLEAA